MTTFAALLAVLLRDPDVAAAIREAVGAVDADPWIPTKKVAELLDVQERAILDAGRRGEVHICGPRGARVMRKSELDRWLASHAIEVAKKDDDDDDDEDRAAIARSLAKAQRRSA